VVVVDNYDSFTYNLVQYIESLGGECDVRLNDRVTVDQIREARPAGVLLSPGPGNPDEAGVTLSVIEQLRRGASFGALAQQFSQGATAQAGGDLGWILPGSLDSALDAVVEKIPLRQVSEAIRTPAGYHILYVVDRRPFASSRPDDVRLNLVQLTLALPINASADEVARATADAQKAMTGVRQCSDLHVQARQLKGATSGDLSGVRVGDLAANRQMYEEIPKLAAGGTAGPFRVAEGMQIVALCSKEGASGTPTRDVISQQILLQKLEAAGRRYMREMRRVATIEVKQP